MWTLLLIVNALTSFSNFADFENAVASNTYMMLEFDERWYSVTDPAKLFGAITSYCSNSVVCAPNITASPWTEGYPTVEESGVIGICKVATMTSDISAYLLADYTNRRFNILAATTTMSLTYLLSCEATMKVQDPEDTAVNFTVDACVDPAKNPTIALATFVQREQETEVCVPFKAALPTTCEVPNTTECATPYANKLLSSPLVALYKANFTSLCEHMMKYGPFLVKAIFENKDDLANLAGSTAFTAGYFCRRTMGGSPLTTWLNVVGFQNSASVSASLCGDSGATGTYFRAFLVRSPYKVSYGCPGLDGSTDAPGYFWTIFDTDSNGTVTMAAPKPIAYPSGTTDLTAYFMYAPLLPDLTNYTNSVEVGVKHIHFFRWKTFNASAVYKYRDSQSAAETFSLFDATQMDSIKQIKYNWAAAETTSTDLVSRALIDALALSAALSGNNTDKIASLSGSLLTSSNFGNGNPDNYKKGNGETIAAAIKWLNFTLYLDGLVDNGCIAESSSFSATVPTTCTVTGNNATISKYAMGSMVVQTPSANTTYLKTLISQYGAVAVTFYVDDAKWTAFRSDATLNADAIYDQGSIGSTALPVVLYGWGVIGTVPYWRVKLPYAAGTGTGAAYTSPLINIKIDSAAKTDFTPLAHSFMAKSAPPAPPAPPGASLSVMASVIVLVFSLLLSMY